MTVGVKGFDGRDRWFLLLLGAAGEFAGLLLYFSGGIFDGALDLVFVHGVAFRG